METKTASKSALHALIDLYDLHTRLFQNVIEGLSTKDANNRLHTQANHPSWIAGSVVHARFELAHALGDKHTATFDDLFKNHKGIQDHTTYPPLDEYIHDWHVISPVLRNALVKMTDEQLDNIAPFDMGEEVTFYDGISFIIDRESYCIGQLGLYRRLLGYEPMMY